ncbi:patatin-like phospholipase family protein [Marinilabiliaceae bacterium ANBcel2]|nr:patatin-like phospholipase family protein [Marinilabiliaceae bacterium ANBcel2]
MIRLIKTGLLMVWLFSFNSLSADDGGDKRPTVGVVLSGGGAKGLAHIGVLQVLEEAGIRPDYIAGTSMGAIVGGLYSIGYSAQELDSIVTAVDWGHLLSDRILLSDVMPEEKDDYQRYHGEIDITSDGFSTPAGFIEGHSVSELISRLSIRVAGIESFKDFPIPFKCVAADLISGRQHVFSDGDFTTALRASMAIPSIFSPVELDSMLLVDGGVLNNFPVRVCKNMGADIIIGVNVGTSHKTDVGDLNSPIGVLTASTMIGNNINMRVQMPMVDIYIEPEMDPYTTASFSDAIHIVERGRKGAAPFLSELKNMADSLNSIALHSPRVVPPQPDSVRIDQIRVNGMERISYRFFLGNLGIHEGDYISVNDLERGVSRLMGTRYFKSVSYRLRPVRDGYVLVMNVDEAERAKFKFSLQYDNEYKARLTANVTLRNILLRGNRVSKTIDISDRPRINLSMINYHGEIHRTGTRFQGVFENNSFPVYFQDGAKYGSFVHNYFSAFGGFMSSVGTSLEINALMEYERSWYKRESGFYNLFTPGVKSFGNSYLSGLFWLRYNSTNRRFFPGRGSDLDLKFRAYFDVSELYKGAQDQYLSVEDMIAFSDEKFFTLRGCYRRHISFTDRLVFIPSVFAGWSTADMPLSGLTYVGGLPSQTRNHDLSFIGLGSREKVVQNYVMAQGSIRYRFYSKLHATMIVNGLASYQGDYISFDSVFVNEDEQLLGYGLLLEYDSILGPLQIGASGGSVGGGVRWYFGFGYTF